jgi:hypothetical protein
MAKASSSGQLIGGPCVQQPPDADLLRLPFDAENRIDPAKVELLEQIERTGSTSSAGRAMNMSHWRACCWSMR